MSPFALVIRNPTGDVELGNLAQRLGVPVLDCASPASVTLARDAAGLVLLATLPGGDASVRVKLTRSAVSRRHSLLARAVGGMRGALVVDATAGLGGDACELATLGYRVVACERHLALSFMLRDALAHTQLAVELREADARDVLATLAQGTVHAVCLDPMFPPRTKSALVKKEAQVLQRLIGEETDTRALFEVAWQSAPRVVVKRSLRAPALSDGVSFTVTGRAVRFDVYLTAGRTPPNLTAH